MAELQIESRQQDDVWIMTLDGEASITQITALEQAFLRARAAKPQRVVLDLRGLSFISSLGMGTMVALHRDLSRKGGALRVAGMQPMVADAFQRARLSDLLILCDSVDDAISGDSFDEASTGA